jgi:hypothetical protein
MLAGMSVQIEVPGSFAAGPAFLDIETRKVLVPEGFIMKNGEPLRNRWQAFLVGIARAGHIAILNNPDEKLLLRDVRGELYWHKGPIVYSATRQFDEMILRGRFTNARRAHEDAPFYPHLMRPDDWQWDCRKPGKPLPRGYDVRSKDVPAVWDDGDPSQRINVLVHLLRDVAELILQYGNPDHLCRIWCDAVLASFRFAEQALHDSRSLPW